jgi:hypothetical protein
VTALFCDLVGFTASSESADPEDVDEMLNAYFAMARRIIESFGGVVEKFIGDAVVGVFGVPAAHEDDPERAVRAGLRIVEEAERLRAVGGSPLRLRVGINTGEALPQRNSYSLSWTCTARSSGRWPNREPRHIRFVEVSRYRRGAQGTHLRDLEHERVLGLKAGCL